MVKDKAEKALRYPVALCPSSRAARQSPGSIELDLDPQSFQEAMASPFAREWAITMGEKLEALEENKTWKEVSSLPPQKKGSRKQNRFTKEAKSRQCNTVQGTTSMNSGMAPAPRKPPHLL